MGEVRGSQNRRFWSAAIAILCGWSGIISAERQQPPNVPVPSYPLASVVVKLERTQCFGPCPIDSITVRGDGVVEYEGNNFVETVGHRTATIAVDQVVSLVNEFLRVRFFDVLTKYAAGEVVVLEGQALLPRTRGVIADAPSVVLTFHLGERAKTVTLYEQLPGGARFLGELRRSYDGFSAWVGSRR